MPNIRKMVFKEWLSLSWHYTWQEDLFNKKLDPLCTVYLEIGIMNEVVNSSEN